MYGPDAMTYRPYAPGLPSKHFTTSCGIGYTAGIPSRIRKSPVGAVRSKMTVLAFGVLTPEIDLGLARGVRRCSP